ncbi:MAG TPA: hypothetical protein VGN24_06865 [Rhodanobacter sp.]|jgi:conjugal transfer/entry exclusion protein|nr:hypothetical protein [Rhodanobacter sp.]
MRRLSPTKTTARCALNKSLIVVLSLAGWLAPSVVGAQVIVTDPILEGAQTSSNVTQGTQLAKQLLQLEQQIRSYATQLEQLRNILTRIQSVGSNISMTPKSLQLLDSTQSDKLVEQACPGPGMSPAGIVSGVISGFLGKNSNQPITERQQLVCKQIVLLQIDEYNVTAEALGELTVQQSAVQKLSDIVGSISTMGESSSASSQTQQFLSQLQAASDTWKKQVEADDSMIATLQQQQAVLSKVALNGSNTVLGDIVQAGAFALAFQ